MSLHRLLFLELYVTFAALRIDRKQINRNSVQCADYLFIHYGQKESINFEKRTKKKKHPINVSVFAIHRMGSGNTTQYIRDSIHYKLQWIPNGTTYMAYGALDTISPLA